MSFLFLRQVKQQRQDVLLRSKHGLIHKLTLHAADRGRGRSRGGSRASSPKTQIVAGSSISEYVGGLDNVEPGFFTLSRGLKVETLEYNTENTSSSSLPNILFLHGSYHGSWCWAANYFDYFHAKGYPCYAMSFLGQSESDVPSDAKVSGTIESHAKDVLEYLSGTFTDGRKVVIVGHSFAGIILQRLVQLRPRDLPLSGAVFLCSVPPTGNSAMVGRFMRRTPIAAIKLSYAFISRNFEEDLSVLRDIFFSEDVSPEDLERYQKLIRESCKKPLLDLRSISSELPVSIAPEQRCPSLVLGSADDKVVDSDAVVELAQMLRVEPVVMKQGIGHDCMLDTRWERVAEEIHSFLRTL